MIRLPRLVVVVVASALLLAGCGGGTDQRPTVRPSVSIPSGDVRVPDGLDLTAPGTDLAFGEKATVAYEPNPKRGTVLELTVLSVTRGAIRDLSRYQLDARTKASVPYYVRVRVANVGEGNVGRSPVPLWAVDAKDTLIQASSFTNTFRRCPSKPLPAQFGPKAHAAQCLVYLIPDHGKLTGISYRPLQAFAPIEWTGKITVGKKKPAAPHPQKKGKKKS
ncbi:MAG TPA: hypothetical protein VFO98_10300 [Marmoricola sp.]|nr:hypothetical protein [Marmoricola sp.]